jgi:DNA-binding NarL/FixJ family response regulator
MIRCLEQGVAAWLEKPCPADQLCRAILLVNEGGAMLSSQAANVLLQYFRARGASIETLSRREREVLAYLSRGSPVQEIARGLKVTKGTIRTHMHRIFVKLGVKSQAEALAKYFNSANLHQPPAAESAAKRAQPAAAPPEAPHPAPLCQTHA